MTPPEPHDPRHHILVVDDEPRMIRFIQMNLELEGYQVSQAANGFEALNKVRDDLPDLIILDVMMPDMDGFETLRLLREISPVPIIMLTVKDDEADKVKGLELGADDYVTKPFSPKELSSRVKAVLRRVEMPAPVEKSLLKIDDYLQIDFDHRLVIAGGKEFKLRPTEYRLLYHLVNNAGRIMTQDQLLSKAWGYEYREESHYLRLYITYLRQKIEPDPAHPRYILTERGVGYQFTDFKKAAV